MAKDRIYNFSAGPSMLPLSVLQQAASEMTNFRGSGMSVMEMSHRSKIYQSIFDEVQADLRRIMNVPDTHEILFMHGGATAQFAAVAMNLMSRTGMAEYAITGNFANGAAKEAKKYGKVEVVCDTGERNHTYIPRQDELKLVDGASYFYYCSNNTIYGTEWDYVPETNGTPIVCDMSSDICSRPVDVSKYGVIFAGVQKNMAPAGMAVVIIDKSLAGAELPITPVIMNYKTTIDKGSMYNTPPCYTIYMLGLVLKWLDSQGGLAGMEKLKRERASVLYDFLDESKLFKACADKGSRSDMNVTFRTGDEEMDALFVKEASAAGFESLKGHRLVGGMRASIYNAMPYEGVVKLRDFMKEFEAAHK